MFVLIVFVCCFAIIVKEEFEDTNGVIRIHTLRKDRLQDGQKTDYRMAKRQTTGWPKRQATGWPKEKGQKDKHRYTKHTHKTKDRVTRTPLKTGGDIRCSGRICSSCSTSDTHRVILEYRASLSRTQINVFIG